MALELIHSERGLEGRQSSTLFVLLGAQPLLLENLGERSPVLVVLITAAGLQGVQPLAE